jgi:type III restriction enzyme
LWPRSPAREVVAEAIQRAKRLDLVDGIKYQRLGEEHYFAQNLFEQEELIGYLRRIIDAKNLVREPVLYLSDTERTFAAQLERNEAIKVYAKLPGWFKLPTPLRACTPNWSLIVEDFGAERLFFVAETKSSLLTDDLGDRESAKIKCGEPHFAGLAA